uniref:cysteinyl leukotriene receptor 2-like isoform X1 n=1 Tax=Styela clava TaxID=7725 RepID=UPI00193A9479|nr:cysteinyl leukotriene receptor 2-like isoform X1 [Styela clava]
MNNTLVASDSEANALPPDQIAELVLRIIFYTIGTIGNLLVLVVILVFKDYKKNASWYVLHLAIADLLFLQTIPINLSGMVKDNWIFPVWVCKLVQAMLFLNYYASIIFLTVMAVDRYLAICHVFSTRADKLRSRSITYIVTCVSWIAALLLCIPSMLYSDTVGIQPNCLCTFNFPRDKRVWCQDHAFEDMNLCMNEIFPNVFQESCVEVFDENNLYEFGSGTDIFSGFFEMDDNFGSDPFTDILNQTTLESDVPVETVEIIHPSCMYNPEQFGWKIFTYVNFYIMFLLPLLVISFCYLSIIWEMKKGSRIASSNSDRRDSERVKVILICGLIVILFVVCWLPFHAVHLAKLVGISGSEELCKGLSTATTVLAIANSALNPFLYSFIGKNFRAKLRGVGNMIGGVSVHEETSSSLRPSNQETANTTAI